MMTKPNATSVFLFLLSTFLFSFSGGEPEDILCWSENRLTFSDFKGVYSDTLPEREQHALGLIEKTILVKPRKSGDTTIYDISACMRRNESWIRNVGDTSSLAHEQGHFDICEIYARILRRDIINAKSKEEAKLMWKQNNVIEELEHDCFDSDNNGIDEGIKPEWHSYIKSRLRELEKYKNPIVKIIHSTSEK